MNSAELDQTIINTFGNKLRLRVCGILITDDAILLVKHKNIGKTGVLWAPPGGGMNFGESVHQTLIREFKEETGLNVTVGNLITASEYLDNPLHAVELFFEVNYINGELITGIDPELAPDKQLISIVEFVPLTVLKEMTNNTLHKILHNIKHKQSFEELGGKFLCNIKS